MANLQNWQRIDIKKAIQILDETLDKGTSRQIELALCEIANIITHKNSLFSLRPIRGAYKYLSDFQEGLIWQFVTAFKKWFAMGTKAVKEVMEEGVKQVTEAVKDLDATLESEKQDEIPGAIECAIEKAGEAILHWMPDLLPAPPPPAPHSPTQSWDEWEARVWRAISRFRPRVGRG